jgi:hypothetical protein
VTATRDTASPPPLGIRHEAKTLPEQRLARNPVLGFCRIFYAERGSPKYEKAAMRWLERHLTEGSLTLQHFAEDTQPLARSLD